MSLTTQDEARIREIFKEEFPKAFQVEFEKTGTTKRLDNITDIMHNQLIWRDEFEELKQKVDLLPTKDEFFNAMDRLFGEHKMIFQELTFIGSRMDRIEDRVDKLEVQIAS